MPACIVQIFIKKDCPDYSAVKKLITELKKLRMSNYKHDINTNLGIAEALYHNVIHVPAVILTDSGDSEIKSWRDKLPTIEDIESARRDYFGY
jgi:hypothetical protein